MKVVVIGAGGHAAVVIDAALASGHQELVGIVDADPAKRGTKVLGVPVIGEDQDLPRLRGEGVEGFIIGLGHSRSLAFRAGLFQKVAKIGLAPVTIVHPRASVAGSAQLGQGVAALAGAIVNAKSLIEDNVILNTGSIVEHDCRIGAHSHLGPASVLCGQVVLESEVTVGAGAVIREGLRIGAGATVGMGAVVVSDVRRGVVVVGNPARERQGAW